MESRPKIASRITLILSAAIFGLNISSLAADTYRWKDKEGKVHYGASVPAEYADQPYDILNNAGIVIEHVEDTSIPAEVIIEEKKVLERQPLISDEVRQKQADGLLVIQYSSEQEIIRELNLELAQLGYDSRLIDQSYESTGTAIRDQIRQAADRQRAGQEITKEQNESIAKLYSRRVMDEKRKSDIATREERIRARFQADLDRYRILTSGDKQTDEEPADQG
jgi:hypothetical protein